MGKRPTRLTAQQRRQVLDLLSTHDPLILEAFEKSIRAARNNLDYDELLRAIRIGDITRISALLNINRAALFPLEEAIRTAFIAGGLSVTIPKGISGEFLFEGRHPRAERIIAQTGARLVTEIGSPGPEIIRSILLPGQQQGIGTERVAQQLAGRINPRTGVREGGVMGLDGPRAARSVRVREILADKDQISKYFIGGNPRYTSTDRRFDSLVKRAIDRGQALDPADAERITTAHDARLLKARGQTIARHEAFTAQAQGRNEAYQQLLEGGKVETIVKRWQHVSLIDPRKDHQALDGLELELNEGFVMDDGAVLQYPHDPLADPKHTIGCRCSVAYIPKFVRG